MRFKEELHYVIAAPREAAWEAFIDFASWPRWSSLIKEVHREGSGWHFRARSQTVVDLVWVVEAIKRDPPEFLEFQSIKGYPHNLDVYGWLRLTEREDGMTDLRMYFDGGPGFESPLLNRAAEWWVSTFDEPLKILKLTLDEFKKHLEARHAPVNT